MSRILRWAFALIGPVFLLLIIYSVHLVGLGLHSQKVSARLKSVFADRPLDPSILQDVDVAAMVEPLNGTRQFSSATQLLVLGAMLERGSYDEFLKQLARPDLHLGHRTTERWTVLAQRLVTPLDAGPDKDALIRLRVELGEEVTRRLTPPLSQFQQSYYEAVRSMAGATGYHLPELPPDASFEMSSMSVVSVSRG